LEEGALHESRVFGVQDVVRRSPKTDRTGTYHVIHSAPWCNVLALTADDEIVLVRQFRRGLGRACVEIPGGLVDPGEAPEVAAVRELPQATGSSGDPAVLLGRVHPNPGLMDNTCHSHLITNAR
jgi:ADP-ribose pyrophosphatase